MDKQKAQDSGLIMPTIVVLNTRELINNSFIQIKLITRVILLKYVHQIMKDIGQLIELLCIY
jgi:hypothetical protein